jgi:hypothetical protein
VRLTNIEPGSELDAAASELLEVAQRYWRLVNTHFASKAVVWLRDTSGQVVVMTRGEYGAQLQQFVDDLDGGDR